MLERRIGELKEALALSRDTENELAKRNTVYQSTIKQLVRHARNRAKLHLLSGSACSRTPCMSN